VQRKQNPGRTTEAILRDYALTYPEAYEEFPWGERAIKVKKKIFVILGAADGLLTVTVKLPNSAEPALAMPFARPTGYGLGKSGWVTCRFAAGETPPIDLLRDWIDESFRAVAPKKVVEQLDS
jgi:predicted DNA-binding protein (MmcQ/YjbR family)